MVQLHSNQTNKQTKNAMHISMWQPINSGLIEHFLFFQFANNLKLSNIFTHFAYFQLNSNRITHTHTKKHAIKMYPSCAPLSFDGKSFAFFNLFSITCLVARFSLRHSVQTLNNSMMQRHTFNYIQYARFCFFYIHLFVSVCLFVCCKYIFLWRFDWVRKKMYEHLEKTRLVHFPLFFTMAIL